jgi:predicted nucleic acid-binding protein
MPYLLDTNALTQLLKRSPGVVERYRGALQSGEPIYLSVVADYQLKRGLLHLGATRQLQQLDGQFKAVLPWAPVSEATWDQAAHLGAECRRQGRPHDEDGDLLLAAQAKALGAVVVTRNTRDFADLQVPVESWKRDKGTLEKDKGT